MLEFCKSRTKQSSSDILNFYVVLAGYDMVTDANRAITCKRKFKTPTLQTESTKNEVMASENMDFTENRLKMSEEKN